jgi:hypothetical protein
MADMMAHTPSSAARIERAKHLLATFLLVVALLFTSAVHALTIVEFDKIEKGAAKAEYVDDLIETAEKSLISAGRSDDSARVSEVFRTNAPNSDVSLGVTQFYMTLAIARVADAKNPNAPRVTMEKVLAVCFRKNDGIKLPDSFFAMAKSIKPKWPPDQK